MNNLPLSKLICQELVITLLYLKLQVMCNITEVKLKIIKPKIYWENLRLYLELILMKVEKCLQN